MKLGSLFDGSGTCPLAASAVGIIPAWASEIEPFPMAVTQSRFPKMKHLGDITKMDGGKIEPVDVITFGSPCQNLSIAGNRKGLAGEQSSLFLEAVRIIREMRCATNGRYPQIAIWENVYGAFSSTQGEDFRTVLETLWQICEGDDSVPRYEEDRSGRQKWPKRGFIVGDHSSIAWRGLDAQFWGVAQRRKRVFLVLDLGGQCAGQILFERDGLQRDFKKVRRTRETIRPIAKTSPSKHNSVFAVESHPQDSRVVLRRDGIVQTLSGRMGTGGGNVPIAVFSFDSLASNSMKSANPHSGCRRVDVSKTLDCFDPSPAKNQGGLCVVQVQTFGQTSYDEYQPSEQSTTLKASGGNYGGGSETLVLEGVSADIPTETENGEVVYLARKLTPTECASLQGFEKDWCALVPHKDSAEYKMWGNGMAFPCMLYIMEGVQEVLTERYLKNLFGGDTSDR